MLRWDTEDPNLETPIIMSTPLISVKLHIALSTVGFIVSTFLDRGYAGYGRAYERWKMLSTPLQARLVSTEMLQLWAPYSLK